jgi:signal transduction histidine kinase
VLDILERVTGSLQMHAKQKNISLGVEIPKDMPHAIEADQALLQQAIYNLVENAIKYTPDGGEVMIQLQTLPSALIFAVQDSGIGIPEAICRVCLKSSIAAPSRSAGSTRHWSGPGNCQIDC